MFAATPGWFADNVTQISVGTLLVLTLLVVRVIQKTTTRAVLLGLIALAALFVYVNRRPLEACAKTCECEIAGRHISVPTCDADPRPVASAAAMELLLIRHALPVRIDEGTADGPADPHLSPLGVAQAEALAAWLADEQVDAIWCSPMRRARETAAPVAERARPADHVDEGLSEFDRDAASYIPIEELKAANDPRWYEVPERPEQFEADVVEAVERVVAAHPGQRVAVVCHGGVINAYAGHVLGIDDPLFFLPAYTSISRVLASAPASAASEPQRDRPRPQPAEQRRGTGGVGPPEPTPRHCIPATVTPVF